MAQTIDTTIGIEASAEQVWAVFSDFVTWPEWSPFLTSLTGDVRAGNKIRVRIEPPGGRLMTFRPKVLVLEPTRELRWRGRLLLPGIFDGTHHFRFTADGGGTRFDHGEQFGGILVGLLMKKIRASTVAGFEAFNEALKKRVESRS